MHLYTEIYKAVIFFNWSIITYLNSDMENF